MRAARSFIAFAFLTACGLATVAAPPKTTASAKPNLDPARFTADIAAFEAWDRQNSAPKDAVLFVGSSSIRLWSTADSFPDLPVINRGFGGSHTSDVIHFADRIVVKYAPRTIIFYAGDNDLADGKPPEQVAADFATFAKLVHAKLPDARIIYLPVKPSIARWPIWPKAQATNDLVRQFVAGNKKLEFVDTATPMLGSDGKPRPEIFLDDKLHMNEVGYKLWTEILADKLNAR